MKNLFLIKDTVTNKISYYHLVVFLIFLPFDRLYSEITLISFLVHTILHLKKDQLRNINANTIWMCALYLISVVTMVYTVDKSGGGGTLEKRLAILLFPLLLAINPLPLAKYRDNLLKIFSFTCAATIVYLFAYNILLLKVNNKGFLQLFTAEFINHNFSATIEMHATYLSLYVLLSLASCAYFLIKGGKKTRILYTILILILLAGIIQLSSRSAFLAMLLIITIAFPLMLLPKWKHRIMLWSAAVACLGLFFLSLQLFPDLRKRNIENLKVDLTKATIQDQLEPRMVRWGAAWELIKASPLLGYGNGSEITKLKEKYFEKKYYVSYVNELNAHNQFLGLLITYGLPGLLLYLYLLFRGFRAAIAGNDFIFISFLLMVIVISMSENLLDVNKGIFFFSFFMALFLYTNPIKSVEHTKPLVNNAMG